MTKNVELAERHARGGDEGLDDAKLGFNERRPFATRLVSSGDDDAEIAGRRPRIDVIVVEPHPFFERDVAAAVDLPQTRDALWNRQAPLAVRS